MNETETKIYEAINEIERLTRGHNSSVEDTNARSNAIEVLRGQLCKSIGNRILKESKKK